MHFFIDEFLISAAVILASFFVSWMIIAPVAIRKCYNQQQRRRSRYVLFCVEIPILILILFVVLISLIYLRSIAYVLFSLAIYCPVLWFIYFLREKRKISAAKIIITGWLVFSLFIIPDLFVLLCKNRNIITPLSLKQPGIVVHRLITPGAHSAINIRYDQID